MPTLPSGFFRMTQSCVRKAWKMAERYSNHWHWPSKDFGQYNKKIHLRLVLLPPTLCPSADSGIPLDTCSWALNCSIRYCRSIQHSMSCFSLLYTFSCLRPTAQGETLPMLYHHSETLSTSLHEVAWWWRFHIQGSRFLLWGLCCFIVLCKSGPERMLVRNSN